MPLNTQIDGNVLDIRYREPWYIQNPPKADSFLGTAAAGIMSMGGKKKGKDPDIESIESETPMGFDDSGNPIESMGGMGMGGGGSDVSQSSFMSTLGSFFG